MELQDVIQEVQREVPPSIWPWIAVAVGIMLALGIHVLVWRGIERVSRQKSGLWVRIVRRLRRPTRLMVLVGVAGILVTSAGLPGDWERAVARVSSSMVIVIFGWMVIIAIDVWAERFARKIQAVAEADAQGRKQVTQMRVLQRAGKLVIGLLTAGAVLATFDAVRQFGVSLFASAGVAGLAVGLAARPLLANLIAGIQIALTQPIKLEDVVIVEGEWGWIEEITTTYVVVRIWDLRRLVVPLSYFIEKPFQNWTREASSIIGAVTWYLDWTAPIHQMRDKMTEFLAESTLWDGKVNVLQVIDTDDKVIHVRGLVSAANSPTAWDLRCEIREKMVEWLQANHAHALPRHRGEISDTPAPQPMGPERPHAPIGSGIPEDAPPESEGGQGVTKG